MSVVKHCVQPKNLAGKYGIDIVKTSDCNSQETLNYLKTKNIDILLLINVYQRNQNRLNVIQGVDAAELVDKAEAGLRYEPESSKVSLRQL